MATYLKVEILGNLFHLDLNIIISVFSAFRLIPFHLKPLNSKKEREIMIYMFVDLFPETYLSEGDLCHLQNVAFDYV